jgi:hypothetical protein
VWVKIMMGIIELMHTMKAGEGWRYSSTHSEPQISTALPTGIKAL